MSAFWETLFGIGDGIVQYLTGKKMGVADEIKSSSSLPNNRKWEKTKQNKTVETKNKTKQCSSTICLEPSSKIIAKMVAASENTYRMLPPSIIHLYNDYLGDV